MELQKGRTEQSWIWRHKAIGVKWVYKTKRNSKGEIERHKARLFKKAMAKEFEMTDIGLMAYYLGIEGVHSEKGCANGVREVQRSNCRYFHQATQSLYYILLYDFMSGTAQGIFWYVHLVYEGNPIAADRWLKAIRRAFSQVDTPSEFWVDFAVYRLTGDAVIWWENLSIQRDMTGVDWEVFEGLFRDNYFNAGHRRMLADMFENIEQGGMTVNEYYTRFMELS
ncbi:hypothetical protein ACOSQ3_028895 [Xanthoceras sorbifolium]